jgi:serine/threonine protein kinase
MTSKLDKFVVGRLLGQGAFAKVKLAVDSESEQKVALKIMEVQGGPNYIEAIKQMTNEVEKVQALSHQNIVNVI